MSVIITAVLYVYALVFLCYLVRVKTCKHMLKEVEEDCLQNAVQKTGMVLKVILKVSFIPIVFFCLEVARGSFFWIIPLLALVVANMIGYKQIIIPTLEKMDKQRDEKFWKRNTN